MLRIKNNKKTPDILQEGYKKGIERGNTEGYHLGYHRGAEIGAEIGFISASIEKLPEPSNEKTLNLLQNLKLSIDNFPKTNVESVNLHESLDHIKNQYKRLLSLMKIKIGSCEKKEISF